MAYCMGCDAYRDKTELIHCNEHGQYDLCEFCAEHCPQCDELIEFPNATLCAECAGKEAA